MTIEEQFLQATSPQEGMLVLARGLDRVIELLQEGHEPTSGWSDKWEEPEPTGLADIEVGEEESVVTFKEVSEKKKEARKQFAQETLRLHEMYPHEEEDIIEAYSKGGPYWLYLTDRDFVMGLPKFTKNQMLTDLNEQDPQTATEVARDILKSDDPGELPSLETAVTLGD